MKLNEYLIKKKITKTAFAKMVGVTKMAVSAWTLGRYPPGKKMQHAIKLATKGKVRLKDWT